MTQNNKAMSRMSGFLPCTEEAESNGIGFLQLDPNPLADEKVDDPALMRMQIETLQKNIAAINSHLKALESAGIFAQVH